MLISAGKLAKELGVHVETIRRWEREGKIKSKRTSGGHRRFDLNQVKSIIENKKEENKRINVIYARVSTNNKKDDLQRQIERLESFCMSKGWSYKVLSDIGSGLNYNKKGLIQLIDLIMTNKVDRIIVNYKDRLVRFGFELIERICLLKNTEIIVVNESEIKTFHQEMVEDILSIITVFSARLYGKRSHKNKKIINNLKEIEKVYEKDK